MKRILLFIPIAVVAIGLVYSLKNGSEGIVGKVTETLGTESSEFKGYKVETVVTGLEVPWSMVFTGPERMLVSERPGRIRVIEEGSLISKPLFTFSEVYRQSEAGLMGLTIDPDYQRNKYIYASYSYNKEGKPRVKVVRMVDGGDSAKLDKVVIDDIIAAPFHDGSRVKFGPDGKLYITTGDAGVKEKAQDLNSPNGKILRLNSDGTIPADNPFPGSPVFSYGHRNPQGIAWQPETRGLWQTEHGPSGFDGPGGGDEINLITRGANYGWPLVSHERTRAGTEAPKLLFTPAIAPSGATFYNGDLLSAFKGDLFFTALRGEGIYRAVISKSDPSKVERFEKLEGVEYGRIREVIEGPDGALYFATSNRDGRGDVLEGDDKILKIVPL